MELIVKVGNHETVVSEDVLLETDYGTSCYGFKFDEKCAGWSENRETNVYFLRYQQDYANELLRMRGQLKCIRGQVSLNMEEIRRLFV